MGLSSIVSRIVPAAVGFATGGPVGAFTATVATEQAKTEQKKLKQQQQALEQEFSGMADFSDFATSRGSVVVPDYRPNNMVNKAGGFFSGVTDFFSGAGDAVKSIFGSGIPQLLGVGRPRNVAQQPAITTVTNVGAQESQGSGSIQAGFGSLVPSLVSGARSLVQSPLGQIGIGTAVGGALSLIDSGGRQIRITRKTKRLAQQAYQLSMGDLSSATQLFAQLSGIGVNEMQFVQILTKRFRNDGAVITKAALRKTKSTLRKMKNMCDMYDSVRKAPARRRASPMKRATTTLIKN